jgi:hypothetical protein
VLLALFNSFLIQYPYKPAHTGNPNNGNEAAKTEASRWRMWAAAAKCRVTSSGENALSWRADRVQWEYTVSTFVNRCGLFA